MHIRGVEEPLPPGEVLLWEGRPEAGALATHGFKAGWIAGYFAVLAVLGALVGDSGTAVARVTWLVILGAVATAMVWGWAWLVARESVYAVTDRRIVMRIGVAFPSVVNLPFSLIEEAQLRRYRDGSGDVAFELRGDDRIGYVFLWPHTRPWRVRKPQPMLRGLAEVAPVAETVQKAILRYRETEPDTAELPKGVHYALLDDDGTEVLSNRRPPREPQEA